MQAVVLQHKLPLLDGWNAMRVEAAARYSAALEGVGDLRLPPVPAGSAPVWHLYVVRTERPEALGAFLAERGVGSGRHYPQPPHLSPAYAWLGCPRSAPVTEALARECLSLPIYPGIEEASWPASARWSRSISRVGDSDAARSAGGAPANDAPFRLIHDVRFGSGVRVFSFVNLYGCSIGDGSVIGPFVEIQRDVTIGRRCKVQSHSFLCSGITIEDEVFIGHGVVFVNDKHPRATTEAGEPQARGGLGASPGHGRTRREHRLGGARPRRRSHRRRARSSALAPS